MFDMTQTGADTAVIQFIQDNAAALASAALLLGGRSALSRTSRLIEDIRDVKTLTKRHIRELKSLHRLLTLEDVADPDREESGFFAMIDPTDPAVEEICLLTTRLDEVLDQAGVDIDLAARRKNAA